MRTPDVTPSSPEVAVTGVGLVTCLGASEKSTLEAVKRGERARGERVPLLSGTPFGDYLAVPCETPVPSACGADRRMRKFMSRHAELAAEAARQAMAEARPHGRGILPEHTGLYAGIGLAAVDMEASRALLQASLGSDNAFSEKAFSEKGLHTIHPLWSFHTLANMPACIISVLEDIRGDNGIYTPWEDQTAFALLEAAHALARNEIDCAVVVASDWPAHPGNLVELASLGFLRPEETAAYGAACLVLERPESPPPEQVRFRLRDLRLSPVPRKDAPANDPLAPLLGRTVAAAPLLLAALAGQFRLPGLLDGCGGQRFSFAVSPPGR
jgi:3-oxoacyl-(acyl-carrier-protein) synthase